MPMVHKITKKIYICRFVRSFKFEYILASFILVRYYTVAMHEFIVRPILVSSFIYRWYVICYSFCYKPILLLTKTVGILIKVFVVPFVSWKFLDFIDEYTFWYEIHFCLYETDCNILIANTRIISRRVAISAWIAVANLFWSFFNNSKKWHDTISFCVFLITRDPILNKYKIFWNIF